jgi:hypothetical protein
MAANREILERTQEPKDVEKHEKKVHTSSYPAAGQVRTFPALHLLGQEAQAVLTPDGRKNLGRPKAAE